MLNKKTKDFSRELRKHQTDAERKIWQRLRDRNFLNLKFKRQYVIDSYIVDFCCPEKMLIIEIDGSQHQDQKSYDDNRKKHLEGKGYTIIRFWNNEVLKEPEVILDAIYQKINAPHPNPLPGRERGSVFAGMTILRSAQDEK